MLPNNPIDDHDATLKPPEKSKESENDGLNQDLSRKSASTEETQSPSPTLLVWCTEYRNNIGMQELKTKRNLHNFQGPQIGDWTHVKEIPNTTLLVSYAYDLGISEAAMTIYDLSKKEVVNEIYSTGKIRRVTGSGGLAYNTRRGVLGAIPLNEKIAYHLYNIRYSGVSGYRVQLIKKEKWHKEHSTYRFNHVTSFDFNPTGETTAIMDDFGICVISDVNTGNCNLSLQSAKGDQSVSDDSTLCRWSTNNGDPSLFVKYSKNLLNVLDAEKRVMLLTNSFQLAAETKYPHMYWIDVCQNNGNLVAAGGTDKSIHIFDKRELKVVDTFDDIHLGSIHCVRWSPNGNMLATASDDCSAQVVDFRTSKFLYYASTSDKTPASSVCFI